MYYLRTAWEVGPKSTCPLLYDVFPLESLDVIIPMGPRHLSHKIRHHRPSRQSSVVLTRLVRKSEETGGYQIEQSPVEA